MRIAAAIAVVIIAGASRRAVAYPQFQLSRDQTCAHCHVSPAGGGMLKENGLETASTMATLSTAPEFFYNKVPTPSWLQLGGDARTIYGYVRASQQYLVWLPMQFEVYASAVFANHFRVHATAGLRPAEYGNEAATRVWSREHYVTWQQNPGENEGLYVRVGRFMPVFGLRWVEHPLYARRFGGTPLFAETYGVAAEYVTSKFEAHATGFIKDPFIDPVVHDSGGALYGEYRMAERIAVGAGAMVTSSADDSKVRGGLTAKYYLEAADLLFQAEGQFIRHYIGESAQSQLVGQLMVTKFLPANLMLDLALGHYDKNLQVKGLDRDAMDLALHYFFDSHTEILLMGRAEVIDGPTAGHALVQLHYRL